MFVTKITRKIMAKVRHQRQAVTHKGLNRRLEDGRFEEVTDYRARRGTRVDLATILRLVVMGILSGAKALRDLEAMSNAIAATNDSQVVTLEERISDNAFASAVMMASPMDVRGVLTRMVLAEYDRQRLLPSVLPWYSVAIDGKYLSTLQRHDLVRLTKKIRKKATRERVAERGPDAEPTEEEARWIAGDWEPSEKEIEVCFEVHFPTVKLVLVPDGVTWAWGTTCLLRSTMISSDAAVCVAQAAVPGSTNEAGHIITALTELYRAYGHTKMLRLITFDAGITSTKSTQFVHDMGSYYFGTIKGNHGEKFREAQRLLAHSKCVAHEEEDSREGNKVLHECYVVSMAGGYDGWEHLEQFVRVHRTVTSKKTGGIISEGDRYFATSIPFGELTAKQLLFISRCHWRCEEEGHWTSDACLKEDSRRPVFSRHPRAMISWAFLHMIAQNILAIMRALSRYRDKLKGPLIKPSWRRIIWHFMSLLFDMTLDTTEFDRVDMKLVSKPSSS